MLTIAIIAATVRNPIFISGWSLDIVLEDSLDPVEIHEVATGKKRSRTETGGDKRCGWGTGRRRWSRVRLVFEIGFVSKVAKQIEE